MPSAVPPREQRSRAENSLRSCNSGSQTGWHVSQTRPGSPTPRAKVDSRVAFTNVGKFRFGGCHRSMQRKTSAVFVHAPQRSEIPAQPFADGHQQERYRRVQRFGLRQYPRHRVAGGKPALGFLALRDVPRHRKNEFLLHAGRRVPKQPAIGPVGAAIAVLERNRLLALVNLSALLPRCSRGRPDGQNRCTVWRAVPRWECPEFFPRRD